MKKVVLQDKHHRIIKQEVNLHFYYFVQKRWFIFWHTIGYSSSFIVAIRILNNNKEK